MHAEFLSLTNGFNRLSSIHYVFRVFLPPSSSLENTDPRRMKPQSFLVLSFKGKQRPPLTHNFSFSRFQHLFASRKPASTLVSS